MSRRVYCVHDQIETDGLDFVPWPGALGKQVFEIMLETGEGAEASELPIRGRVRAARRWPWLLLAALLMAAALSALLLFGAG